MGERKGTQFIWAIWKKQGFVSSKTWKEGLKTYFLKSFFGFFLKIKLFPLTFLNHLQWFLNWGCWWTFKLIFPLYWRGMKQRLSTPAHPTSFLEKDSEFLYFLPLKWKGSVDTPQPNQSLIGRAPRYHAVPEVAHRAAWVSTWDWGASWSLAGQTQLHSRNTSFSTPKNQKLPLLDVINVDDS